MQNTTFLDNSKLIFCGLDCVVAIILKQSLDLALDEILLDSTYFACTSPVQSLYCSYKLVKKNCRKNILASLISLTAL